MTIYKLNDNKLEEEKVITGRSSISAIAYSPDGSLLAVGEAQGKIAVYDTSNYEVSVIIINIYNFNVVIIMIFF